ncbi:MAG: hypothetical protein HUU08_13245 [Candidatus Brocadia sp.]|nr:hypothetical protein [Candidatus Brocadia sp.]
MGSGTIILAKKGHTAIQTIVEFSRPARLQVTRGARKLLKLAAQDLALHTDSDRIYGLVKNKNYDEREEDLFTIRFLGHHHWEVAHAEKILMRVNPTFAIRGVGKPLSHENQGVM